MNAVRRSRRGAPSCLGRRLLLSLVGALLLGAGARSALAQATIYVNVMDPAYHDLDMLVSAGLVRDIIVGERPYSRAAFRRFVAEATHHISKQPESPAIHEALDRLARRFASTRSPYRHHLHAAPARIGLTEASSPYRPLRSGSQGDRIKGRLDPLLQNDEGRTLEDGFTAAVEGGLDVQAGRVAGEVIPRVYLGVPRGAGTRGAVQMVDAYARAVFGPVAVDLGRNNVILGYGANGGPLLSVNPRGMDMIRVSADRPVRLPGVLSKLGLWQASMAVADLGKNRQVPYAKQVVMRLSARPSRYFEIGLNYTNMQGGSGAPRASLGARLTDLFLFWSNGGFYQISDKVAGADFRVSVPRLHSAWYVNFATTDDRGRFQQPARGYWNDAIWTSGIRTTDLGPDGRLGFRLQWVRAGPRIYTHHQFTSGQTLDGNVLGDALGPNAWQILAQVDWTGTASRLKVTAAWERYSGGLYNTHVLPGGGKWDIAWYKVYGAPPEVRRRIVADYSRFEEWHHFQPWFELGYEHVTRFDYNGPSRDDLLAQVSLRYHW